jgi:hypothetical protein
MRLRQVVLVARDLDAAVRDVEHALGIEVGFRDPDVATFGIRNAVLPIGDTFLEVISPVEPDAPAERYLQRHGGGGYMLLVQTHDLAADRQRLDALGVRIVWSAELDDIAGAHLHPKDTGGPLLSLDQPHPPGAWRWAGPRWREHVHTDVATGIAGAVIASPDPGALAQRWGELLDLPLATHAHGFEIALEGGALHFVAGPVERLAGFDVTAARRARAGDRLRAAGVEIRFV